MIPRAIKSAVLWLSLALAVTTAAHAQHKWTPPRMPPPPGVPATTEGPVVAPPKTEPGQKSGAPKFIEGPLSFQFVSESFPAEIARATPARIVVAQADIPPPNTLTLPPETTALSPMTTATAPPQVVVPAPQVTVTAPNVSVSPPAVNVTTPQVNVQAPESGGFIQIGKLFGQQMQPYVDAIIQALALAFAGWITTMIGLAYKRITGKELDEKASNVIATAAKNQAGALLAAGAVKLQGLRVNVPNDKIALAVDEVMTRVPDALKRFGLKPQDVENRILEAIPQTAAGAQIIADAHAAASAPTLTASAPIQPN